uniref:Ig-like domain-containing protein n=1 Tax=Lacinutrix neustonica TaxID=2980107 RepID=UPI0028BE3368|nr:Ig-like domain-containing protein [Lacinutrix neustonica]
MRLHPLFALFLFIILVTSCKKEVVETDNLFKFRDYISYTTSGRVSVTKPITINLHKAVEGWELNQDIKDNIVSFNPDVSGRLVTKSKHSLLFYPDEPLDPDTEYTVTVKLGAIYSDMPSGFENYTFQFKTITPNFNVVTNDLQSYSKAWQYLLGVVKSADDITIEEAKQLVHATQDGKKLNIEWNESQLPQRVFEFKIDSISRNVEDSEIEVTWNGKAIKADNAGSNMVTIPGRNNFTITRIEVVQNPEQYLLINFSDPIKKQQNFDGLVTIQNTKNPKYIVEGNILKAYPRHQNKGCGSGRCFSRH